MRESGASTCWGAMRGAARPPAPTLSARGEARILRASGSALPTPRHVPCAGPRRSVDRGVDMTASPPSRHRSRRRAHPPSAAPLRGAAAHQRRGRRLCPRRRRLDADHPRLRRVLPGRRLRRQPERLAGRRQSDHPAHLRRRRHLGAAAPDPDDYALAKVQMWSATRGWAVGNGGALSAPSATTDGSNWVQQAEPPLLPGAAWKTSAS